MGGFKCNDKDLFFRGTNKGGGGGKGDRRKSKLLAIAKWMQRRLMWLCEESTNIFKQATEEMLHDIVDNGKKGGRRMKGKRMTVMTRRT